ncbi:hypothetical protein BCR44DRAFT_1501065 [Catenaria anguillulae PL171]|uniref:Dynein regulatory complex protein 9 n=1 Tax=Catenaria anguillulae PL171 TaxID=765915 RepID=A0A1Y2HIB0_9FUNG|nr:hypothetical protein BCR44DRAFT_1501065 [Catenaria anguillulae PL171]
MPSVGRPTSASTRTQSPLAKPFPHGDPATSSGSSVASTTASMQQHQHQHQHQQQVHTRLELPTSARESVVAILEDAVDQLDILDEIAAQVCSTCRSSQQHGTTSRAQTQASSPTRRASATSMRNQAHSHHRHHEDKVGRERRALRQLLQLTITELRAGHVSSMLRAVDEEKAKRNLLFNTLEREKEAAAQLRDLHRAIADEQKQLDRDRKDRDTVISQLREAIQEIQALTASEQKYLKRATRAHESALRSQYTAREFSLMDVKQQVARDMAMEDKAHVAMADFLHRQRGVLERSIQDWMQRHEEDTEKKAAEIDALKNSRLGDVDKYEELVAKYEELERMVEEDRTKRARELEERRAQRALESKNRAVKLIQNWWRALMLVKHPERAVKQAPGSAGGSKSGSAGKKGGKKSASAGKKKGKK